MSDVLCILVGCLISISIYLMLSSQLLRWLFGIVILSSTINLVIFVAGRLYSQNPAFIPQGGIISGSALANPLPQALILTAIVISFGLLAFALVLVRKVLNIFHTTDSDLIGASEKNLFKTKREHL